MLVTNWFLGACSQSNTGAGFDQDNRKFSAHDRSMFAQIAAFNLSCSITRTRFLVLNIDML